jgi:hypothetical protein
MIRALWLCLMLTSVAIAQTDTMATWQMGWDACFETINATVSPDADALIAVFNSKVVRKKTDWEYFSALAHPDTVSAWINKGYKIKYFGSKTSTGKIPVRGMRPK